MATFQLVHEVGCDADRFFEIFFDPAFNAELYKKALAFPVHEVISIDRQPDAIAWRTRVQPKLDLPGPVEKVLGKNFGYVEEGRWDKKTGVYTFTMVANTLADKLHNSGTVRVEPLGPGKLRRVVDIRSEAKIFGIGGIIESVGEKAFRDNWNKSAAFMTEYCARKGA